MRALIVSAAGEDGRTRAAMSATRLTRVLEYVRIHLRDPDLTPATRSVH